MVPYPEDDDENPIDEEEEELTPPKQISKPVVKPLGVKPVSPPVIKTTSKPVAQQNPKPSPPAWSKPIPKPASKPVPTLISPNEWEPEEVTAPSQIVEPEEIPPDKKLGKLEDQRKSGEVPPAEGQEVSFTHRQVVVGKTLYFILAICIIFIVGATAWTISDLFLPTGKFVGFLKLPFGAQLAIIGAGLFVLFLLLISFYTLSKRGALSITRVLFTSKRMYQEMKVKTIAKIMTGGLMVAILLVTAGLVSLAVQVAAVGSSNDEFITLLQSLTGGELALMIGLFAIGFTGMAISFEWLWNVGNIFFARKFLKA